MNDENKRPSIKGIKNGVKDRFTSMVKLAQIWKLQHQPTRKAGVGEKITILDSNSYVMDKEKGKGYAYFEGLPKNTQPVVGFYIKKTQENTEEQQQKKGNKLIIVPIVMLLGAGALSMKGCTAEETVVEKKEVPIEVTIYDIENPSVSAWGLEGQAAQEGKYVNEMQGQGSNGKYYDSDEVYQNEYDATKNSEEYEIYQEKAKEGLKNLEGKEATTVELADIQENIENMDKIYVQKESVVQENYDKFMEYVDMYLDGNTQIEKETAGYILESFDENQELIQENQKTIEDLINKAEEGTVNIHEIKEEKDGDIKITGEQIVEMVKKEKVSGIKAAFQNMQNFFKGLFKENTNDQR